jgi:hypothetical protein
LRRLGVGGGGGGDRPLRAQLVVALVVGLILIAVPLYLWRRPNPNGAARRDAGVARDAGPPLEAGHAQVISTDAAPPSQDRVQLGAPQRVRCSASRRVRGEEGNLCDELSAFDHSLADAIRKTTNCAPHAGRTGSINYVLTIDFGSRRLHVFPGASGQWKGREARHATECVERALARPDWSSIRHQYRFYMIAILATYPAPGTSALPTFK